MARQHTDKKRKDSPDVQLAQPKSKKKSPAQVARGHARRKEFWKRRQLARQLRAENLALHYRLLESQTEASPQSSVVSQPELENSSCLDHTSDGSKLYQLTETETVASPQFSVVCQSESENSACLDRTSDVSQSSRYLTNDREVVNTLFTAQDQSELNKLSAEAAVEHSSILKDKCDDFEPIGWSLLHSPNGQVTLSERGDLKKKICQHLTALFIHLCSFCGLCVRHKQMTFQYSLVKF